MASRFSIGKPGPADCAEAASAARLSERRPHVSRPDPATGGSLSYRRARSAGVRSVGYAGAGTTSPTLSTISPMLSIASPKSIGFDRFAVYVFDYGAPTGFRLAMKHPERITAIISQNGNAYEEGLSDGWTPIRAYWQDPSQANRDALRAFLAPETTYLAIHARCQRSLRPSRRTAIPSTTSISRVRARTKCNSTSSATTRATSRSIRFPGILPHPQAALPGGVG